MTGKSKYDAKKHERHLPSEREAKKESRDPNHSQSEKLVKELLAQASCGCREKGIYKCEHERIYSSHTTEFCYDHHHKCFVFGDRYYHIIIPQHGHDFPIHAHMPGGNESDYTLSLSAEARLFFKQSSHTQYVSFENNIKIMINFFP